MEITNSELTVQNEKLQVIDNALPGYFNLLDSMGINLKHDRSAVQAQTMKMCEFLDLDPNFFSIDEGRIRPLILIGLSDNWLDSGDSLTDQRSIIELLKVLSAEGHKADKQGQTAAGEIERLSKLNYRFAYEYASGIGGTTSTHDEKWIAKREFATSEDTFDEGKTKQLLEAIDIANLNSPLKRIREELGVTDTNEKPFNTRVVRLTREEMASQFDGTLAFMSDGVLCLPSDFDFHLAEHEYIHSQQHGVNFGASGILGRGVMEGWTEQQTETPVYYENQRAVLSVLLDAIPELKPDLDNYHHEKNVAAMDKVWGRIMATFGLDGLIAVLRMAPDSTCFDDETSSFYRGKYIFINSSQVQNILQQKGEKIGSWDDFVIGTPLLDSELAIAQYNLKYEKDLTKQESWQKYIDRLSAIKINKHIEQATSETETAMRVGELIQHWQNHQDVTNFAPVEMVHVLSKKYPDKATDFAKIIYQAIQTHQPPSKDGIQQFIKKPYWFNIFLKNYKEADTYWDNLKNELVKQNLSDNPNNIQAIDLGLEFLTASIISDEETPEILSRYTELVDKTIEVTKEMPNEDQNILSLNMRLRRLLHEEVLNKLEPETKDRILNFVEEAFQTLRSLPPRDESEKEDLEEVYLPRIKQRLESFGRRHND
jgi:hypothetical protein